MLKYDFHTHWGVAWAERDGEDPARWLDRMDAYGLTHALVLPEWGLKHAGRIGTEHDQMARVCARSQGRMLPAATACLWDAREAERELRRCVGEMGFRAIKFHPWLQGISVSLPAMDAVAQLAVEYDVPIIFHDGTPPFSLPSQIALLAQRHPDTQIVLGHAGLFEHCHEAAAAMRATDNIWACLCGPRLEDLRYLLKQCPLDRLLWGSDAGFGLADVYAYRIALTERLPLDGEQAQALFETNPRVLLRE